ncbi:MAG: hypothetical protein LJE94_11060 [Deltaproteobacteria bacterium]|nr:hypothetical protein [Deltaproteobacteria bacterium]
MRKFVIFMLIMGLVGSAGAAEVTYHFTANIDKYTDSTGLFEELGYSGDMIIEGTISYDPEAVATYSYVSQAGDKGMALYYDQGYVTFSHQVYEWLGDSEKLWYIETYASGNPDESPPPYSYPYHTIKIKTSQASLNEIVGVSEVAQVVYLVYNGWNMTMPAELTLGIDGKYFLSIKRQIMSESGVIDEISSDLTATITSIMDAEEYAASKEEVVNSDETDNPAQKALENQERCHKYTVLKKRIEKAIEKLDDGNISNYKAARRELEVYRRQAEKWESQDKISAEECENPIAFIPNNITVSSAAKGKKKK